MRVDRQVGVRSGLGGVGWVVVAAAGVCTVALLVALLLSAWAP
jgi:hypothetical protein